MSNRIKCVDIVSELVEEATRQFGRTQRLSVKAFEKLRSCCEAIDSLAIELDALAFEAEIDDITTHISIAVRFPDIIINMREKNNLRIWLIRQALSCDFTQEDGDVVMRLVYPGVWENA